MRADPDFGFLVLEPPYSSDLARSDYLVFPQRKKWLKGGNFYFNEGIIETMEAWFAEQDQSFLKGLGTL